MTEHKPAIGLSSAGRHTLCIKNGEPWPCRFLIRGGRSDERERAAASAGADPEPRTDHWHKWACVESECFIDAPRFTDEAEAGAQGGPSLDVERLIRERLIDLRSCNKDDDCQTKADGIELALSDVEYARLSVGEPRPETKE